jgi:hypothetical protein
LFNESGIFLQLADWEMEVFEKQANYLQAALKVFRALADNSNNGGLQTVSANKTNVTAS